LDSKLLHGSGFIVSTAGTNQGKHIAVGNGDTLQVSTLLRNGDSNPNYDNAIRAVQTGAAIGAAIAKQ
jgi:hypothetical protein